MKLRFLDSETAIIIKNSLSPENKDFLKSWVEGDTIFCTTESDDPMRLLHTLDDYLSCLGIAEQIVERKKIIDSRD